MQHISQPVTVEVRVCHEADEAAPSRIFLGPSSGGVNAGEGCHSCVVHVHELIQGRAQGQEEGVRCPPFPGTPTTRALERLSGHSQSQSGGECIEEVRMHSFEDGRGLSVN